MKLAIILALFLTLGSFSKATSQNAYSGSTKIIKFEVDGKEIKKDYKVFFRSGDKWIESKKSSAGFILPADLRATEYLTVLITSGKYKLEFSKIHISKFNEDWVVGVDKKPFSDEIRWLIKSKSAKRVHYIIFKGSALETVQVEIEN
jgi:hypothetical protein